MLNFINRTTTYHTHVHKRAFILKCVTQTDSLFGSCECIILAPEHHLYPTSDYIIIYNTCVNIYICIVTFSINFHHTCTLYMAHIVAILDIWKSSMHKHILWHSHIMILIIRLTLVPEKLISNVCMHVCWWWIEKLNVLYTFAIKCRVWLSKYYRTATAMDCVRLYGTCHSHFPIHTCCLCRCCIKHYPTYSHVQYLQS